MDILTTILAPIVESVLVPVKRELKFLFSSSNYVRVMQEKVRELDGATKDMHTQEVSKKANSQMVPSRVPGWLKEVEDIKASVEGITTRGVRCFNIKTKYISGKRSADISVEIDRLMKEKAEMSWTNDIIPLSMVSPSRPSTSVAVHEDDQNQNKNKNKIKSRDLIFSKALKFLEPDNINTQKMAICGMPGVGKTTMMEQLEKDARDKNMFNYIVKVAIGRNPSPMEVQQKVAELTGGVLSETTIDTRAESLKKRLQARSEEGKMKFLVILDDVWEVFNLTHIGLASDLPNGFKLLLTSREETVCSQMKVEDSLIFRVKPLEEPEDKELFWETTRLAPNSDIRRDVHQIAEDIIKRCGGLPLAITAIASALGGNTETDEWVNARSRLHNSRCDDYNIKEIFEISYENLKDEDLKSVFLICGLFPEDYSICKEDILKYGWGLKFFQYEHTIAEARTRLNTCVKKLIRSNLLIESDREGCVKMHDLVRDFVLSSFSKVKQASIAYNNSNVWEQFKEEESYERMLIKCADMSEIPKDFNHPNLKFFKLMGENKELKFPADFYTRMEKLEVVTYENVHGSLLPRYSTNLRALSIHSSVLAGNDISFLGDLINLEVLSLAHCGVHKLPSNLQKLKKLKLLNLTGSSYDFCIDDGVLQNLDKLEELYLGVGAQIPIRFTDANCEELKLLSKKLSALEVEFFENNAQPKYMSFEKLERFRISVGCLFDRIQFSELSDNDTKVYAFKNTLKLVTSRSELVECKISELFGKTEILYLKVKDMNHLGDVSTHPPQHSFGNLKVLEVVYCTSLAYLFTIPMTEGLTKLESLEIRSCPALKSMINCDNSEVRVITFHKLKILHLYNLPELVSLCDPLNLLELPQLVELHLDKLQNVTSIFPENYVNISAKQPFLSKEVVIPKLEKLRISRINNLKEIWACEITSSEEEVNDISMLREIQVEDCNSLVNIFPCNPMRILSHLEYLTVSNCGSIEVLFNIGLDKTNHLTSSSSLRSIRVSNLENLREVWRIKDAENNNSDQLICGFQAVQSINVNKCARFRNIVMPNTTNFDMRALKDIRIWNCGEFDERKNELVNSSQAQEIITRSKEEISNVGDNMSIFSFSSDRITNNFHQLRYIMFDSFQGVEVVFEIESPSKKDQLITSQQPLLLLPNLENLQLQHIDTLRHVWKCKNWNELCIHHKHQPQCSLQNLKTIRMDDCKSIKYLFSPLMVKLLTNLRQVSIISCDGIEEVVSNRDDNMIASTSVHTTTNLFPHLDILELSNLCNLKHIGGGFAKGTTNISSDQSKFSQVDDAAWLLCQYSNKIHIYECHALSSVIPSYGAGRMQKLQVLSIQYCSSMTEVFETTEMNIYNISNVHQLSNLKDLQISGCHCLEYVFTISTLESLKKLETLTISNCKEMKMIVREDQYEKHILSSSEDMVFPHLKSIKLVHLPNLEVFQTKETNNDNTSGCSTTSVVIPRPRISTMHKLPSLKILTVGDCERLENIFTFSTLKSLQELEKLTIKNCKAMKVVVKEEFGEHTMEDVVFPHLKSIELAHLPILEGFLLGMNIELQWPLLDYVMINDCPQIIAFTTGRSSAPRFKYMYTELGKHNSEYGLNFNMTPRLHQTPSISLDGISSHTASSNRRCLSYYDLMEIKLAYGCKLKKIIPSSECQNLQKLETIHAEGCSDLEEVFEVALEVTNNESQTVVKIPKLREMDLEYMKIIKYIWKSNQSRILEFPNLTRLSIDTCMSFEYVFTSSMVGSLVQIQELHIRRCGNIKAIVKQEEEEDCDAKFTEIKLPCLRSLKFILLESLEGFCLGKQDFTLPSLDTLEIKECPRITVFTQGRSVTPELTAVETDSGSFDVGEDINTFIATKIQQGSSFGEL